MVSAGIAVEGSVGSGADVSTPSSLISVVLGPSAVGCVPEASDASEAEVSDRINLFLFLDWPVDQCTDLIPNGPNPSFFISIL